MNRRQSRAAGPRRTRDLERLASCPDCKSWVTITEVVPGIHNCTVEHDDTCPWFAAFQRNGGIGVRFVREENR